MKNKTTVLSAGIFIVAIIVSIMAACSAQSLYSGPGREIKLLNNRARDITGATPLSAPGLIAPDGLTGEGQVVAIADSGLDRGVLEDIHPDLKSTPGKKPRVTMLKSWAGRERADDPVGHGTHMAATIAGTGAASGGRFKGIAPGASIYFQGILDPNGKVAPPSDLHKLFTPAYQAGARIHVDAWGGGAARYNANSLAIDKFTGQYPDFLVVLGAGNGGPGKGTLTAEANSKNALAVGASTSPRPALDAASPDTPVLASFSSRGPTPDGRIKPELLAPGTSIVSARASGVEGNMPGYPDYTRMQGTSMAAAVAGGAAALLRQFFQQEQGIVSPPAALIKAALINGARTGPGGPTAEGFGVLDLAGAVLALKAGEMSAPGETPPLSTGGQYTADYQVRDPSRPLKVTLAWTDPAEPPGGAAGLPGSLVNILRLEVLGPDGRVIYGNHFLGGGPDRKNNVQQVYIETPAAGQYTIKVIADSVSPGTPGGQSFALVYGQPLKSGIITGISGSGQPGRDSGAAPAGLSFTTDSGVLEAGGKNIQLEINGVKEKGPLGDYLDYLPGAQYYAGSRDLYIAASIWRAGSVQVKKFGGGRLWTEADQNGREGGYYQAAGATVRVNGQTVGGEGLSGLPPGIPALINYNPVTGQVWQVTADYRLKEGTIYSVTGEGDSRKITLTGDDAVYSLPREAALIIDHLFEDTDPLDASFGAFPTGFMESLLPGIQVQLVLDPNRDVVSTVTITHRVVAGVVSGIDRHGRKIMLNNGKTYNIFDGAPVYRQERPASLDQIKTGDYICAVRLPGADNLLALADYPRVVFGNLVYLNSRSGDLLFNSTRSGFSSLSLESGASVTRWGMPGNISALSPGDWLRLILSPGGNTVRHIAVADRTGEITGIVKSVEPGRITLADGSSYLAGSGAVYTRESLPVKPGDIIPGDQVTITPLVSSGGQVIAGLSARNTPGRPLPEIKYTALALDKSYIISGVTGVGKIYIQRGGDLAEISPNARGEFTYSFIPSAVPEIVTVIAVNERDGVVSGRKIAVPARGERHFTDVTGHWAEQALAVMAGRGLIVGYPDGAFRPDLTINREELAVLLARCLGWTDSAGEAPAYRDRDRISAWAGGSVASLRLSGIMNGYPDGRFHPRSPVTRAELAVILEGLYRMLEVNPEGDPPSFIDLTDAPAWAREAVEQGVLAGYPGAVFAPMENCTRAEVAVVLYRLLQLKETR